MEKQRWEESERRKEEERTRFTVFFQMICGSGGSKSRLARAAGEEPAGQIGDEKLHAVVARSTFGSEKCQKLKVSDHFWNGDVEKVHALVARSTFRSQNAQNPSVSERFW